MHFDWLFMNWIFMVTKDSMEWEEHYCLIKQFTSNVATNIFSALPNP